MTVFGPMQRRKACKDPIEGGLVQMAVGERYPKFVPLSDIPQIARALEYSICRSDPVDIELMRELAMHCGEIGVEPFEVDAVPGLKFGANRIVFEVRGQQAHCRSDAGIGRYDDLGNAERPRHLGSVQWPSAAERDESKAARVEALLHSA